MISVLYVDDEAELLELAKIFLEASGEFAVTTLESARDALSSPDLPTYDIIIADYQMPVMNGIVFLKEIRERFGNIPFILFTGKGREEVVIQAINNGADFYLQKGGDPEAQFAELVHKIHQAVNRRKAEIALKESEKRLGDIISFLPDATFAIDRSGRVIAWNRAIEVMTGITAAEMLGKGNYEYAIPFYGSRRPILIDLISGPDTVIPERYSHIIREKDSLIAETSLPQLRGAQAVLSGKASPLYNRQGEIVGAIESIRDITGHKRLETSLESKNAELTASCGRLAAAEQALRESESKFRSIFENSPYPIAISSLNDNTFLEVNKALLKAGGYTEEEMLGKDPVSLGMLSLTEAAKLIAHRVRFGKLENVPLALTVKGGRKVHVLFSTIPITIGKKSVMVTVTAEVTNLKRVEEDLLRKNEDLNAAYEEISAVNEELRHNYDELSRKEEALRESEEKYRLLVGNTHDIIYALDLEGRITHVSPNIARYGLTPENILSRNIAELINEEDLPRILAEFQKTLTSGQPTRTIFRLKGAGLDTVWFEDNGTVLRDSVGRVIGISGVLRDITERRKAEEALQRSEQRFLAVTENAGSWIWEVDAEGIYRYSSPSSEKILGYLPEEIVGKMHYFDLFDPAVRDDLMAAVVPAFESQEPFHDFINANRHKDGRKVILLTSGTPLFDETGEFSGYCGIDEDITSRTDAESAFQTIVRSMVGSTGLASLKKMTENVASWLEVCCVMVGEIQPDGETVRVLSMVLDGKEVDGFTYHLARTPCENVAEKGFCLYPDNVRNLFPDAGDLKDLDIRGYAGTPLRNSRGEVMGILCALSRNPIPPLPAIRGIFDIIAAKAASEIERAGIERALQESEEKFRALVETSPGIIWEIDTQGNYRYVSPMVSRIMGYDPGDLVGKPITSMIAEEKRAWVMQELAQYVSLAGPLPPIEIPARHRDGHSMVIEIRPVRITDSGGSLAGFRGIAYDITDRRKADDALKRVNRQLGLLTGITRHDTLNKLTVIYGYLKIAEKKCRDPELSEFLGKIEATINTIRSQIEFTRTYQKVGVNDPQWIGLDRIVSSLQAPPGISLHADIWGISIFADPMLEKVFSNLLDNSVRHGEHVTEIRLLSHGSGRDLILVWEDNGIGIPADEKELIFERGYGRNTGMGMFLVREILALTGITIAETGNPGTGARFEIRVPEEAYRMGQ